ncbi:DUF397 domain-containing protein [Streptomyces enissocaesilis]|jgi:hypothetical protein|uniref:DUF397 domain-containing protein n=1 Tax=Streptomyces TaxID=1883 RepID=UPI000A36F756|nr:MULTISPECIES: DUF397 domain-containing protein [Streptomyces]WDI18093.1 DUF397 domain-containing protein [Streptomyces enissocaesilis]MBQ0880615.1 DUF397 domain-containing protein [Streptomyces sp. RT42]QCR47241.1 DUF397 domain-containing protein [Streptomyces sp. SGAir0924]RSS11488.1 DUF397 domain-containing protein [Streptomyces sp. WAC08401]RSS94917.1 DUF397 domain-containing protein [Streptomyces sp. WAC02707]
MSRKDTSGHLADLAWFKSSYSDTSNPSDCVEVAITPATIHVRDSKRPDGPRLTVPPASWTAFVAGVGKA